MNLTFIIISGMLLLACSLVYLANKKIAASLYTKTTGIVVSPYHIMRAEGYGGDFRYYIAKKNRRVDHKLFYCIEDALDSMNELEMIEGYTITEFKKG